MQKKDKVYIKNEAYHTAGLWQIGFFALNNCATNLYMAMMGYVSYYVNGIVGVGVVAASMLLTALNVFDGITDPIAGVIMDKTGGRFGKFRPFMVLGNLLMALSCLMLFLCTHRLPAPLRLPFFVLTYGAFVIGYTCQTVVTKSAQTVLTSHPRQRPLFTTFDSLFTMASYGSVALFASNYLVVKYGSFTNARLFREFVLWIIVLGMGCTALAVLGIWSKDQKQYYGVGGGQRKVRIRDYWDVIRNNRPVKMLVLSACLNKFAASVYGNVTVGVMLFGILMQDYSIAGLIGVITAIPTLFVVAGGIRIAQGFGQKKAFVVFTWAGIVFQLLMFLQFLLGDVTRIRFGLFWPNAMTLCFFLLFTLLNGCKSITNNMVVPMIADCSDYEVYRSGRYVPGMMGALFSFVDKIFAALGTSFVGLVVTVIGYGKRFPQVEDLPNEKIKAAALFTYCLVPVLAWLCSMIFMRFYNLDKAKMGEIQVERQREHKTAG